MSTSVYDWQHKRHSVAMSVTSPFVTYPDYHYRRVTALIDNTPVLADVCHWTEVSRCESELLRSVENYLDGHNHPSHYTGTFAHLARH